MITKRAELVQLLLDYGASVSVQNRKGHNCYHVAVLTGATDCLKVLTDRHSDIADLHALDFEGKLACSSLFVCVLVLLQIYLSLCGRL